VWYIFPDGEMTTGEGVDDVRLVPNSASQFLAHGIHYIAPLLSPWFPFGEENAEDNRVVRVDLLVLLSKRIDYQGYE
jgi:hypothetical protein